MEILLQPIQKRIQQWPLCLYQLLGQPQLVLVLVLVQPLTYTLGWTIGGTRASSNVPAMHTEVSSTPVTGGIVTPASRDTVQSQLCGTVWLYGFWMKGSLTTRNQPNKESARRSSMRKQERLGEVPGHKE
ncbi:hypothetical protein V6N11_058021 [Hibiscus sabdariffa]|uniref:Uncharacterized protein n=1 Tax=Hibiscus sabdariffa TaxID=183260 RepID=A0ABR1ZBV9_9ROSI